MSHNFTNGKWSDHEVPKRDWYCIGGYDRGRDNLELCDMCESASVRYVHIMRHDAYPDILEVGCVCAGNMEQDAKRSKRREADVRNRSKRRAKWPLRKWSMSRKGNPILRVLGYFVTVFRRGSSWGWFIVRRIDDQKWFSTELYATEWAAKEATFDAFEKLCEEAPTVVHWCYPSLIIGCGLPIDDLCTAELTSLRRRVTCPRCLIRLRSDRETCEACRLGSPEDVGANPASPHVCDPMLA